MRIYGWIHMFLCQKSHMDQFSEQNFEKMMKIRKNLLEFCYIKKSKNSLRSTLFYACIYFLFFSPSLVHFILHRFVRSFVRSFCILLNGQIQFSILFASLIAWCWKASIIFAIKFDHHSIKIDWYYVRAWTAVWECIRNKENIISQWKWNCQHQTYNPVCIKVISFFFSSRSFSARLSINPNAMHTMQTII